MGYPRCHRKLHTVPFRFCFFESAHSQLHELPVLRDDALHDGGDARLSPKRDNIHKSRLDGEREILLPGAGALSSNPPSRQARLRLLKPEGGLAFPCTPPALRPESYSDTKPKGRFVDRPLSISSLRRLFERCGASLMTAAPARAQRRTLQVFGACLSASARASSLRRLLERCGASFKSSAPV